MQKFDPDNLSLSNILIILIPAALLFAAWMWVAGKPYDYDGARGMAVDSSGVTHIQVDKLLYRFDVEGSALPNIDLNEFGVGDFVGDLSFNANGELLLRRGSFKTEFLENISIYFRVSNKSDSHSVSGDGLSLCNLATTQCRAFGESTHDFNRGYFSVINPVNGATFVSDASRHEIHKFDLDGRHLASLDHSFEFPNELVIDKGHLFLVDTNNKAVKQLNMDTGKFGSLINVYLVANPDAEERGHKWPYSLEKVGDHWWVIILDSLMNEGGVYIYDANWSYVKSLPLEADATPVAMLSGQNEVLVSDIEAHKVMRFTANGEYAGVVKHDALNIHLAANREQRLFYQQLKLIFLIVVSLGIAAVFVFAYRLRRKTGMNDLLAQGVSEPASVLNVDRDGSMVEWIPPRSLLRSINSVRKIQLLGLCVCLIMFGVSLYYINSYINPHAGLELLVSVAPIFIFVFGLLLLVPEAARMRLGTLDDKLVLHDQINNRAFMAQGNTVIYDGQRIAFGELSLQTGSAGKQFYDNASFTKNVFPLLADAHVVNTHAMQIWVRENEKTAQLAQLFKVIFIVLAIAVVNSADIFDNDIFF